MEILREKLVQETQQLTRQIGLFEQASARIRTLEEDKNHLDTRLHKLDLDLNSTELSRDGLKRDKNTVRNEQQLN